MMKPLYKILLLLFISKVNRASIAGVTYMDDFDFEQRYRNLYECDPFYWHPLHLPEECAEIFAKLIRSKISTPYRVVREREPHASDNRHNYGHEVSYGSREFHQLFGSYNSYKDIISESEYLYDSIPIELYHTRPRSPLERLFELMRRDVNDHPSAPKITSIPHFGGVALYRQPVSFKTEAVIKKISGAYGKAAYQP